MSQKVLGGGLLVGVGYVLYQLFNNDENKEVNSDLELKDVTKNILKDKNDFDLEMEKVDLDKEIETEAEPKSSVEENTAEVTQAKEETSVEETSVQEEKPIEEETSIQEEKPVEQEPSAEETNELEVKEEQDTSLDDLTTDDSNTIERIVRI